MTLEEHIDDIRDNLRRKVFTSEALVSEGIVRRLLEALEWPRFNPQIVIPEYPVEGGRVDFALCHPPSKPLVFIEVKPVGKSGGAEKQLFEYAFHKGVPVVILTDGKEWHFFHPSGQGEYNERKVYNVDLTEVDHVESTARLSRYLNYQSICTGEAIKAIEDDYRAVSKQRQTEASLPEAWIRLVQEEDEILLDVVAEKTESLCGNKPSGEQVLKYLNSLVHAESRPKEIPLPPIRKKIPSPRVISSSRFVVTMSDGERIDHPVAADTFVETIEKLGLEQVEKVNPKLLSTSNTYRKFRQRGRYYINIDFTNDKKKTILDNLSNTLGARLLVESHPKGVSASPSQQEPQNSIGKKPPTRFVVTMPDDERIDRPVAADTFADAIEKLGLEQVEKVKPKLISTSNVYSNFRKRGRYYININLNNDQKKNHLEDIAEALGVRLNVKIVPKN
ncbi:MAG: hypothetical protein OXP71_14150 [Candidatus Poribacteria bacterium]|nr:hypothetical protein [Candidatus Poribacteria bacterium]